MDFIFPEAGFL